MILFFSLLLKGYEKIKATQYVPVRQRNKKKKKGEGEKIETEKKKKKSRSFVFELVAVVFIGKLMRRQLHLITCT